MLITYKQKTYFFNRKMLITLIMIDIGYELQARASGGKSEK